MAHEGVPLVVIQRQLGHANLGITSIYLQGIDSSEIISTVHRAAVADDLRHRRPPAEALGADMIGSTEPQVDPTLVPQRGEQGVLGDARGRDLRSLPHEYHKRLRWRVGSEPSSVDRGGEMSQRRL
jgi:hypothetical protein